MNCGASKNSNDSVNTLQVGLVNSKTYFELDSEEATHCHHCHLISCVYIKGLDNTKDQSNVCMCERSLNSFN